MDDYFPADREAGGDGNARRDDEGDGGVSGSANAVGDGNFLFVGLFIASYQTCFVIAGIGRGSEVRSTVPEVQPQILRLRWAQKTRPSTLRMTGRFLLSI